MPQTMPVPTHASSTGEGCNPELSTSQHVKKKGGGKHAKSTTSHLDVNAQLLDAVQHEKPRVVRRMLESRADPNACNGRNETPLMLACSIQKEEARDTIMKLLLKKGAEVNLQDNVGQTALMKAILLNDTAMTMMLLDNHSDVSLDDCDGNNALCHAATTGNEAIVQRVVKEFKRRKLDVDRRNMRGLTPLLIACQAGHLNCAKILVFDGGASPSIRDLDNFMNAEDWMRETGFCSSPELAFLSPTARKRNYYRKQRQMRGIKTLSDFLPLEACGSEPNVFMMCKGGERNETSFPQLSSASSTHHTSSSSSQSITGLTKSMFDLPSASKHSTLGHSMVKPVPVRPVLKPEIALSSSMKTDLYRSPYLSKRQHYLSRNRRSEFYHQGSLEPLGLDAHERLSQVAPQQPERTYPEATKHHVLPPLKRQSSKFT